MIILVCACTQGLLVVGFCRSLETMEFSSVSALSGVAEVTDARVAFSVALSAVHHFGYISGRNRIHLLTDPVKVFQH